MTTNIAAGKEVSRLLREYTGDQHCLWELLLFWGKHPRTHFSRLAIVHALDSYHTSIEKALGYLAAKGVVKAETQNHDLCYSLTDKEPLYSEVTELVKLYWWKWEMVDA